MRCVDCLPLIEEYFDGEVEERLAGQMSAHLSSCADCSAALDALSFEQEVYARYDRGLEVTPALWARVSAEIAREPLSENRIEERPFLSRVGERFAAALSSLTARPALASSFALLLVGVTAGSLWFTRVRPEMPRETVVNVPPSDAPRAVPPSASNGGGSLTTQPSADATEVKPTMHEGVRETESASSREATRPRAGRDESSPEVDLNVLLAENTAAQQGEIKLVDVSSEERVDDSPASVPVGGDALVVKTDAQAADPADKEVARHVEQAQMLLRSIKNARAEGGDTFNVAYEKNLSRRLLSDNATLQLDADTRGDKDTKQVLDRIEPYLIDIANMHDKASREEVRSLRERIDSKEIIAALQVY